MRVAKLIVVLWMLTAVGFAAADKPSRPNIAVEELVKGPDRAEIPWKVKMLPPRLMYQQRFLVQMKARIPADAISGTNRVLHFVIKAQTEDGQWLKDEQYNNYPVPANLGKGQDIEYATGVYLRPGNYTLALIAYEAKTNKTNVIHKAVRVERVKNDPFPELDTLIPQVEFPVGFPQQDVGDDRISDGELFPIAHQDHWVPINNKVPIQLDIVLDVSRGGAAGDEYYRRYVGLVVQIGNVLSHMEVESGCIRVSVTDILRMKTIFDRTGENTLDWDKFEQQVEKYDQNTVDAGVLANKKGPARFAQRFFRTLYSDQGRCGAVRHYVILVSANWRLPSVSGEERLGAEDRERATLFWLTGPAWEGGPHLSDVVKPAEPRQLTIGRPQDFRKAIGTLVKELRASR